MTTHDDRFKTAAASGLMSLDDALAALRARLGPVVGTETVALRAALGRVLAEDVVAGTDVPPHDNAAMDGYCCFAADLAEDAETRLPVNGRIAAGHPLDRPARRGEALRIFTGAPLPEGPDTVIKQEDCRTEGDDVILPPGLKQGDHVRYRGESMRAGAVVIPAGRLLRPQEVGLAAAAGHAGLVVRAPLKAAVFSTGDEIRDPGQGALPPGCQYDANRYTVIALLEGLGCTVTDLGILADDPQAVHDALLAAAPDHHLIVTSGGVSMGEEDHVKGAVESLGALHFWKLAIKPGKPIALGEVRGTAFVGLPGNPVSAAVTFMLIGRAVACRLMGRDDVEPPRYPLPAGFSLTRRPGRREWLRGRLSLGADGVLRAETVAHQGSGVLTSMVEGDGLIEVPEDTDRVAPGDVLSFIPFAEVTR